MYVYLNKVRNSSPPTTPTANESSPHEDAAEPDSLRASFSLPKLYYIYILIRMNLSVRCFIRNLIGKSHQEALKGKMNYTKLV